MLSSYCLSKCYYMYNNIIVFINHYWWHLTISLGIYKLFHLQFIKNLITYSYKIKYIWFTKYQMRYRKKKGLKKENKLADKNIWRIKINDCLIILDMLWIEAIQVIDIKLC